MIRKPHCAHWFAALRFADIGRSLDVPNTSKALGSRESRKSRQQHCLLLLCTMPASGLGGARLLCQIRNRRLSRLSLVTGRFVARHDAVRSDKKHIGFAGAPTGNKNARLFVFRHFEHLPTPVAILSERNSEPQRLRSPFSPVAGGQVRSGWPRLTTRLLRFEFLLSAYVAYA